MMQRAFNVQMVIPEEPNKIYSCAKCEQLTILGEESAKCSSLYTLQNAHH